jgi:hypothetical protein
MDVTELAASRDEEEAALLVSSAAGDGRRGAGAASETRDAHLLSSAFFFVFLAYHAAQNLQSTVNTVRTPHPPEFLAHVRGMPPMARRID